MRIVVKKRREKEKWRGEVSRRKVRKRGGEEWRRNEIRG